VQRGLLGRSWPRQCMLALAIATLADAAVAGGLYVNEFSTTAQATAGAGRGAWAADASATLHNPATMTQLDDHAFSTGFSLASARVRFDRSQGTPSGGGNGQDQAGIAPIASLNYVHRVSDRIRAGFTFFSLSGSVLDPSNRWAGRFEVTDLSLLTISISPTVAVRVTDWLSIGGGPIATYGVLDWDLRVDFPVASESAVRLDDLDDWEPAGRVGLLLHPRDDLALSVYYNSKTDFELSGQVQIPAGLSANFDISLPLAQFVELGAWWQATERLALLATFNWEDWSEGDDLSVTLGTRNVSPSTGFRDTYKVSVGATYELSEGWLLQSGVGYDTSALRNRDRTTALPIDRQIRVAFGLQRQLSPSSSLALSFLYANLGQAEVRTPNVRGDYDDNELFLVGLALNFKELWWSGRLTR